MELDGGALAVIALDEDLAEDHAPSGRLERCGITARWSSATALGHVVAEKADNGINGLALQRPMHLVKGNHLDAQSGVSKSQMDSWPCFFQHRPKWGYFAGLVGGARPALLPTCLPCSEVISVGLEKFAGMP